MEDELEADILAAHQMEDGRLLCELYRQAAELKLSIDDENAAGFLFTQAYVFGLETDHPDVKELRTILFSMGREDQE